MSIQSRATEPAMADTPNQSVTAEKQSTESPIADQSVELSAAQFIELAETDREAAIRLMWPDAEDADAMRFLDAVAFDGFIESLKAKVEGERSIQ